jgi:hypothetical protein
MARVVESERQGMKLVTQARDIHSVGQRQEDNGKGITYKERGWCSEYDDN